MPDEHPLTCLFEVLIERAGIALTKPMLLDERELVELNEQIEAAVRKPVDGVRLIHDEDKLLARCVLRLMQARRVGDHTHVGLWQQIIGVLLPVAREHFSRAIEAGRSSRPETTNQDYAKR